MVVDVQVDGVPVKAFLHNEVIQSFGKEAISDFHYVSKGIKKILPKVIPTKDSHWKETNGEVKTFTKKEIDEMNRKENRMSQQNLISRILELLNHGSLTSHEISEKLGVEPKGIGSCIRWLLARVRNDFGIVEIQQDGTKVYGFKNKDADWSKVLEKYLSKKGTSLKKVVLKRRPAPELEKSGSARAAVPWQEHIDACHLIAQLESLLTLLIKDENERSNPDKALIISLGRDAIKNWSSKYSK